MTNDDILKADALLDNALDAVKLATVKLTQARAIVVVSQVPPPSPAPTPAPPIPDPPAPPAPVPTPAPVPVPPPAPVPTPAPVPVPSGQTLRALFEKVTGLTIGYSKVLESDLASMPQTPIPEGESGWLTKGEGATGARGELGIVTDLCMMAAASGDPRAAKWMDYQADVAKWMPIHYPDLKTGKQVIFRDHPRTCLQFDGWDQFVADDTYGNKWGWGIDNQHQPHFLFMPLLEAVRTGNTARAEWLLDQMIWYATRNYLMVPYTGRGFERGMFITGMSIDDQRGGAWATIALAQTVAAMVLMGKQSSPYFAEFIFSMEWNIKWAAESFLMDTQAFNDDAWGQPYYDYPNGRLKNKWGFSATAHAYDRGDGYARIGMFQQNFWSQAYQTIYGMMKNGYLPVNAQSQEYLTKVNEMVGKLAVMMGGDGKDGRIDYRRGMHQYDWCVGRVNPDGFIDYFETEAEMATVNYADLGPLDPNENPPYIRYHGGNNDVGPVQDGYLADYIPTLACAVRDNIPGAKEAWARLKGTRNWAQSLTPGVVSWPFAIVPPGDLIDGPVTAPAPAPTDPATLGTPVGADGATFTAIAGKVYLYGTHLAQPTPRVDNGFSVYPAGNYYSSFKMPISGQLSITPAALGIPDPIVAVVKHLYLMPDGYATTVTSSLVPQSPAPAPQPAPAPGPASLDPALFTFNAAGEGSSFKMAKEGDVKYGADTRWAFKHFAAGVQVGANNSVFGDPASGTVKAAYTVDASYVDTSAPTPAPAPTGPPPSTVPVGPGLYIPKTLDDLGDQGPDVDPKTWLPGVGNAALVPFLNTPRDCVPDYHKGHVQMAIDNWPGGTFLPDACSIWIYNGGHANDAATFALQALLRKRRFVCSNTTSRSYSSDEMSENAYDAEGRGLHAINMGPDDVGTENTELPMHGYNAILTALSKPGRKEHVVYGTQYKPVNTFPCANPRQKFGGFWHLVPGSRSINYGGYGIGCMVPEMDGFLISDSRRGEMWFQPLDASQGHSVSSVIETWYNGTIVRDAGRGILIGFNINLNVYATGNEVMSATIMKIHDIGMGTSAPTVRVPITLHDHDELAKTTIADIPFELQCDRMGIDYLPGCGFFGVQKKADGSSVYVRGLWNDPSDVTKGITLGKFVPSNGVQPVSLFNGVYGSFNLLDNPFPDLAPGVKMGAYMAGPDSGLMVFQPPLVAGQ